jgi:hypothetical protein
MCIANRTYEQVAFGKGKLTNKTEADRVISTPLLLLIDRMLPHQYFLSRAGDFSFYWAATRVSTILIHEPGRAIVIHVNADDMREVLLTNGIFDFHNGLDSMA